MLSLKSPHPKHQAGLRSGLRAAWQARVLAASVALLTWTTLIWTTLAWATSASAEVRLEGFWVRAMPPGQAMTAAYGQVINTSDATVILEGASTSFASRAEIHESQQMYGRFQMVKRESIAIPAGETLSLAPGGIHVMIMGVSEMPAAGSQVSVCLQIDGTEACVAADVLRNGPNPTHDEHSHHGAH